MHFGNAHTNGDTVVYFPNLKVVAVATCSPLRRSDFAAGGSLVAGTGAGADSKAGF